MAWLFNLPRVESRARRVVPRRQRGNGCESASLYRNAPSGGTVVTSPAAPRPRGRATASPGACRPSRSRHRVPVGPREVGKAGRGGAGRGGRQTPSPARVRPVTAQGLSSFPPPTPQHPHLGFGLPGPSHLSPSLEISLPTSIRELLSPRSIKPRRSDHFCAPG